MAGNGSSEASLPGEGLTEKGDGESTPNLEGNAIEATPMSFKMNPNTATLVSINREVTEVITAVNSKISKTQLATLNSAYGRLLGFALELINENTTLTATMAAYKEEKERAPATSPASESVAALQRTFSQVLQQNPSTSSRSPAGQQQEGAPPVAPMPTMPPPPAAPRESLLVYPASKPAAGVEPFEGISHLLRTTFKPAELRLGLVQIKPVRGGAIVLGHSAAALDRLAEAIKANEETASQLTTRRSEKRAPQVKIMRVDPGVEARDLVEDLTSTNNIPTEDQNKVVASFRGASGTMVHILEVGPRTRDILLQKRRVHLGWTSCPVYENLGVRRCTKCCTYGHTAKVCASQSPACTVCSGDHPGANCRVFEKRCRACIRNNEQFKTKFNVEHPFGSRACRALLEKEQQARRYLAY
ncbi:hypothetical protein HPB47_018427 [Ixodes persulcatus]|uniref:Uncharacterized protein n=1 Tax=Ixodes persulcatus TaxID=34615 RepID=A0AC60QKX5_IXOPE|nr:hypothetical protein HPB47_018427 [Ixodes persulcatus]